MGVPDIDLDELERLAGLGLSQSQIGDWFGFSDDTFQRRMKADPEIVRVYKTGRARATGRVTKRLWELIEEKNPAAIFFWLKTQARWRETERVELTGKDGGPITHTEDASHVDWLKGELSRLAARQKTTTTAETARRGRRKTA